MNSLEANYSEDFTGITTKSIVPEILSLTDNQATVMVSTQRIATDEKLEQNVYYKDIKIFLVKSNDIWLVNSAYWQ